MNHQFDEITKSMAQSVTRRAALKKFGAGLAGMALACFGLANHTTAAPSFTSLDFPGAVFTAADDINAKDQITGWYIDTSGVFHGFLLDNAAYTSITFPGAIHTSALGLNANGDVVGAYFLTDEKKDNFGYVLRNGTFTSIGVPGAAQTRAFGINTNGDIVGIYTDQQQGKHHGFLLRAGVFTSIDFPGSAYTDVWKINDAGQIAGRYQTGGNSKFHLFLLSDGIFTAIADFPEAVQMAPTVVCSHHSGLNGAGDIVTAYSDSTPVNNNLSDNVVGSLHGLLWSGGGYTVIDFPNANFTVAYGINDSGVVVGAYQDTNGAIHGYLRTP